MVFENKNPAFCKKKFYSLFWSGLATGLLFIILGATDSILAGIFVGEEGVSAISVTAPIASAFSFVISVFASGCRIKYPEEIGRGNKEKAAGFFSTALTTTVILSVLFLVLMILFGSRYFEIYNITGNTLKYAEQYFTFNKYVYVLTPFVTFISQMVYSDGGVRISMAGSVTYCILNILLSIVGASYLGMTGIGLGTFVSGIVCFAINCIHFFRKNNMLKYHLHYSFAEQRQLVKFSFMESTFALFSSLNGVIITGFLCSRFGSEYLAVNSVVGYAMGLTALFGGLSEAMLPILNIYRGENNRDGVKKILRVTFRTLIVLSVVITLAVLLSAPLFPGAFSITSPKLINACISGIRITSISYCFIGLMTIMPAYYNAQGKVLLSTIVARFKDSIFYVLFFVLFGTFMGIDGVWIGIMLSPVAAAVLLFIIVYKKYGKKDFFMLPEDGRAVKSWDLTLNTESIISLRDSVEAFLKENKVSENNVIKAAFLIEEVYGLILENNMDKKSVMAELTVLAGTDIELIFRDDGNIFDITDEDSRLTSFRAYVLYSFEQRIREKNNITSLAFNRSRFKFTNGSA